MLNSLPLFHPSFWLTRPPEVRPNLRVFFWVCFLGVVWGLAFVLVFSGLVLCLVGLLFSFGFFLQDKSHSRLPFAHSTRTISAEGCAGMGQIAPSPAFRALDTHDLRRGLRGHGTNRTLACISRTRHARSPWGCAHTGQIALWPALRALDTHDLGRGLHFRLTLFVPPSAFKGEFIKVGKCFHQDISRASFPHSHLHYTCILLHLDTCRWMLSLFHLHWDTSRSAVFMFMFKSVWKQEC